MTVKSVAARLSGLVLAALPCVALAQVDAGAGAGPVGMDVTAAGSGPQLLPHDLSPLGMFLSADLIVKGVLIGLAFASVVTWTVWLSKTLELMAARRRARQDLAVLAGSASLMHAAEAIGERRTAAGVALAAALREIETSGLGLPVEGIKERIALKLSRLEALEGRRIQRGTGVLATIGSTAPFVGLFGTVWGIMNSFIGISKAHTTNLAVVAPGIAEALLATAIGLVAAIPAVVVYNLFSRAIAGYRASLGDASAEILRLASRDLDRAHHASGSGRATRAAE